MYVVATFTSCRGSGFKASTVVVKANAGDVAEVIKKLSTHSCYYQSHPEGYLDLIVVGGRLIRCELVPAFPTDKVGVLTMEQFRTLWDEQRQLHLLTQREWKERLRLRKRAAINRMPVAESRGRRGSGRQGGTRTRKRSSRAGRKVRK